MTSTPISSPFSLAAHTTKPTRPGARLRLVSQAGLLFLVLGFCALYSHAAAFKIISAEAELSPSRLMTQARFDIKINETVTEALHNGIALTFVTRLELYNQRRLLWDKRIGTWQTRHELSYHSLSDRYQLRTLGREASQSFTNISEALRQIEDYKLDTDIVSQTLPKSKKGYELRLRVALDTEALPPALRIVAYALPKWRLKSKTRRWALPVKLDP